MSTAHPAAVPADRTPFVPEGNGAMAAVPHLQRIPGSFQFMLGLYLILTGSFPTIVQAFAFGLPSGVGSEFAAAMISETARDLLLLAPVVVLANHRLGILHPLLLAVVVWPVMNAMPTVIEDWGGWGGILAGAPVETPYFIGLPGRSPTTIWTGIAVYNGIQILALTSTYFGFWLLRGKPTTSRPPLVMPDSKSLRTAMLVLIGVSLLVLLWFVRSRGGVNAHLTSLGAGRFKELSSDGLVMLITDLGATAIYIWIAARPGDIKSPLFLMALAGVMASEFISNGSRGSALVVPMTVAILWALRRQKVPWKIAIMVLPFMFISLGLLGAIRHSSWYGSTADQALAKTSFTQSYSLAQDEVAARHAVSANVPVVSRGFEVTGGPLLGQSYAAVVTAFVPRPIWPDKPRGVGSLYARLFLGVSFQGTSIPVSPEAEMYWNFGVPGVLLLSMLYGAFLRAAYNFFWRRYPDPFVMLFYVIFLQFFQFSSDRLVVFEQQVVLLLFCYSIVAMFIPKDVVSAFSRSNRLPAQPRRIVNIGQA